MRVEQWQVLDPKTGIEHVCYQDDRMEWFVFEARLRDLGIQSIVSYEAAERSDGSACTLAMYYNERKILQETSRGGAE